MRYLSVLLALIASTAFAEHWGTFPDGGTLTFYTNTISSAGAPSTPASEAIAAYDATDTQTSGAHVAIDDDVDSLVGYHRVTIDTTNAFFAPGGFYTVIYTAGTSDGISLVGRVIGSFRLSAAELIVGIPQAHNAMQPRTWYVDDTDGAGDTGTREAPFDTIAAAVTACASGDTIKVNNGTYTEVVDLNTADKYNVTIEGESRSGVVIQATVTGFNPVIAVEEGTTIRNLTVLTVTGDGTAINGFNKGNITIEACDLFGDWDCVLFAYGDSGTVYPRNIVIRGCKLFSTADVLNLYGCQGFLVEDCYLESDCTGGAMYVEMHGIIGSSSTSPTIGRVVNTNIKMARGAAWAGSANAKTAGLTSGGTGSKIDMYGGSIMVTSSHATDTGSIKAVGPHHSTPLAQSVNLYGVKIETSRVSGSGTLLDVDSDPSGTLIGLYNGTTLNPAKWNGSNIDSDLRPMTAGRRPLVASTGHVGPDQANIGNPTATVVLSGTTIGTLTTYTGNTPQTGDNFAIVNSGTDGLAAIRGFVDDIGVAGAGLTAIPGSGGGWDDLRADHNIVGSFGEGANLVLDAIQNAEDFDEVYSGSQLEDDIANIEGVADWSDAEKAQILAALSVGQDIGVPAALTWTIARIDGQMKAKAPIVKDVGESVDVAADFRGVLADNDAILEVVDIELIDDTGAETITSAAFADTGEATLWMNSAVRFTIAGGTVGDQDRVRVKVLTVGGSTISAPCQVNVTGGP